MKRSDIACDVSPVAMFDILIGNTSPVPNIKGGWMTRVIPPMTRTRLKTSKRPQASLRKRQERRVTNTLNTRVYLV